MLLWDRLAEGGARPRQARSPSNQTILSTVSAIVTRMIGQRL
jgi:hypothetical protein